MQQGGSVGIGIMKIKDAAREVALYRANLSEEIKVNPGEASCLETDIIRQVPCHMSEINNRTMAVSITLLTLHS